MNVIRQGLPRPRWRDSDSWKASTGRGSRPELGCGSRSWGRLRVDERGAAGGAGARAAEEALAEKSYVAPVDVLVRMRWLDQLLMSGTDRAQARALVRDDVERVLDKWRGPVGSSLD